MLLPLVDRFVAHSPDHCQKTRLKEQILYAKQRFLHQNLFKNMLVVKIILLYKEFNKYKRKIPKKYFTHEHACKHNERYEKLNIEWKQDQNEKISLHHEKTVKCLDEKK